MLSTHDIMKPKLKHSLATKKDQILCAIDGHTYKLDIVNLRKTQKKKVMTFFPAGSNFVHRNSRLDLSFMVN